MICKKCKTAVPEQSASCQHCGAAINKGDAAKKAMGVTMIIAMLAVCGVYIYFQPDLFHVDEDAAVPAATDMPQANAAPGLAEPSAPTAAANLSNVSDDVFDLLRAVYDSAQEYNAAAALPLISRRGFLYDLSEKDYVTVQTLADENFLSEMDLGENIFILYIQPSSLADFSEIHFPFSTELTLMTAYETKDGIALFSENGKGVLYRENYNALIEKYSYDHGDITRPDSAAASYQNMLDAVVSYSLIPEEIFVRYAATDEKYGVIVISKATAQDKPEGFVLEKIDGRYSVVYNNFESDAYFQAAVNRRLPDMSTALLPNYSLYDVRGKIKTDFPSLVSQLQEDEIITETDRIIFSSGTDRYAYIVFTSGLIILGNVPAGESVWTYSEVTNWYDAELRLSARESLPPPAYILWQN
ncbi:MAG: hypothetical protein LBU77_06280 [Clostridiales bacterium]|nr:hypothetical protein [Clostridiales bacterium]